MSNLLDLPRPYFPNPVFAWTSVGLLVLLAGIAAYTDTRRAKVPNALTVTMLVVGLVVNIIRGAWQAAVGHPSWLFGTTDSIGLGMLDGFLFGLSGFLIGFGVFFLIWMFGLIGGGDVKLFAAIGGWIGLLHLVMAWMISVVVLIFWALGKVFTGGLRPGKMRASMKKLQQSGKAARGAAENPDKVKKNRVTYSLPIAVAVLLLSVWSHRVELLLSPPKPVSPPNTTGATTDDTPPTEPS